MDQIINYVKPELLSIIPVLYFLGIAIKKSSFKDSYIPIIIGVAGILICSLYVFATSNIDSGKDALLAIYTSIVQGILCAGCTTYANQLYKQLIKENKEEN